VAQRRCPLRFQGRGVGGRRHVADRGVRPRGVEVLDPAGDDGAGVVHREEQMLVEAFVPHSPLETLGEGVLGRLARGDVAPVEPGRLGEGQNRRGGELGAIVADDRAGLAAPGDQRAYLPHNPFPGQGCVRDRGEAFLGHVVDDRQHPEPAPVGELVVHKVGRPPAVGTLRPRDRRARYRNPAPRPAASHRQALFAIEPLGLLAVHAPALAAQKDVQAAVTEPSPLIGQLPQPPTQGSVVGTLGPVADRAPVRSNDGARPPLAHLEASSEMRDRFPPGGGRHHFFASSSFSPALSSIASA
jgi:hypothetical protein